MRRPTICASLFVGLLLLIGCGSPSSKSSGSEGSGRGSAAGKADTRNASERAEAIRSVEALEAAISAARAAVASAATTAATATRAERLRLSDTRRAIVAANVALQKAREALSRDDYAAAQQATLGVAEHLKGIQEKMRP